MDTIFEKIPDLLSNNYSMSKPNENILIHKGDFSLVNDTDKFVLTGSVSFRWQPSLGVVFEGSGGNTGKELAFFLVRADRLNLHWNGNIFTNAIESFKIEENITYVNGRINGDSVEGDTSIDVSKVTFCIPNLRMFSGSLVKYVDGDYIRSKHSRLIFEDDDYHIILDRLSDYEDRQKALEASGGVIIQYNGLLQSKKRNITHGEAKKVLTCFGWFLSFLNGRRTSPVLLTGIDNNGKNIWTDWNKRVIDPYTSLSTWPPRQSSMGLPEAWQTWQNLWKVKDSRDLLTSCVIWYTEASSNNHYLDTGIIIAQTALELLYNWLVVEQKKLIVGNDSEKIGAANKIRLLLGVLETGSSIPQRMKKLAEYRNTIKSKRDVDAPELIVNIRNAIVHSQKEKRQMLNEVSDIVKWEALQIALWYIELALLYTLKYNYPYWNRCAGSVDYRSNEELPPWVQIIKSS